MQMTPSSDVAELRRPLDAPLDLVFAAFAARQSASAET